MDIVWADVLRASLSFFLVVVGIGIAYVCFRLGGVLRRMSMSVVRVTDEVVPILSRAQTTVDGINLELSRVDEIMVSAVNATKGAEKTVTSLSHAVTTPVKKASSWAGAAREAMATFRARRAQPVASDEAPTVGSEGLGGPLDGPSASAEPRTGETGYVNGSGNGHADQDTRAELHAQLANRQQGPSISQISWALPKRKV